MLHTQQEYDALVKTALAFEQFLTGFVSLSETSYGKAFRKALKPFHPKPRWNSKND